MLTNSKINQISKGIEQYVKESENPFDPLRMNVLKALHCLLNGEIDLATFRDSIDSKLNPWLEDCYKNSVINANP